MGRIVVCGGSVVGLAVARMLARDGHEVTVLESDPDGVPGIPVDAWSTWNRGGVAQFRQPHVLFARFRQVVDEELPGTTERLLRAGCVWADYLHPLPPGIADRSRRPGDDDLLFVTGRRPVVEAVLAAAAEEEPGVTVRRGVRVTGFVPGPSAEPGVAHVAGVRTATGEQILADLVVDAMGRRSRSADWVAGLGGRAPHVQSEDSGFAYYTRYFTGPTPPRRIGRALVPMGSITLLTLHGDNDTWSVTVFAQTGDAPLKALRDAACFTRVVQACPMQAHWLDGTPITEVLPMAGIVDRYRRFAVDGVPVATGLAAVGDAWACTNPSAGRGTSIGLLHAQVLRNVVRKHLDDPAALARDWDEGTERVVAPYYWNQIRADRARFAEMEALRQGTEPPVATSAMARLVAAAGHDPDAYRALVETVLCVSLPQDVLERPAVRAATETYGHLASPAAPGPGRNELLRILAA